MSFWRALPVEQRRRVHLVTFPMGDLEENAAMVNALQRCSDVVAQNSIQEGFGLTVTEAMLKSRPVVASAVGGIPDQIEDGKHGVLLADAPLLFALLGRCGQDNAKGEIYLTDGTGTVSALQAVSSVHGVPVPSGAMGSPQVGV